MVAQVKHNDSVAWSRSQSKLLAIPMSTYPSILLPTSKAFFMIETASVNLSLYIYNYTKFLNLPKTKHAVIWLLTDNSPKKLNAMDKYPGLQTIDWYHVLIVVNDGKDFPKKSLTYKYAFGEKK